MTASITDEIKICNPRLSITERNRCVLAISRLRTQIIHQQHRPHVLDPHHVADLRDLECHYQHSPLAPRQTLPRHAAFPPPDNIGTVGPDRSKSRLPVTTPLRSQFVLQASFAIPSRPVVPGHVLVQHVVDHLASDLRHIARLHVSAADRVKPITVYGQLFVPHVKIPFDIPPPGRTQRRISLSQNVPESLKYLQVTRFHVEQPSSREADAGVRCPRGVPSSLRAQSP